MLRGSRAGSQIFRARENCLLPGRHGTFHVWFNANGTLHTCGCACAGAWVKACAVIECGWGASFRLSFEYSCTLPHRHKYGAFFARWVPLGGGWQPHSCQGNERRVRGCLGRRHGGAPCAKRVREGGAGASQYTWSAVAVPSPPLSSPTDICSKWTRAGPRVFAAQLAQVRQASLKSTSPMPCQCAMGPGQQAGREMWHAVLVRPAENCGVLSCVLDMVLEALEDGCNSEDRRGGARSPWGVGIRHGLQGIT